MSHASNHTQKEPCLECGAAVDLLHYEQNAGHCHRCRFKLEQDAAVQYEAFHSAADILKIAQAYLTNNQLDGYRAPESAVYTPASRIKDATTGLWQVFIPFDFGEGIFMDPSGCFMYIDDETGVVIDMPPVI